MDTSDSDEKSTYIFLDFNGKLPVDAFKNDVFFRIANLQTKNPFVQVNDTVFKGSYDYAMGTNLIFNHVEESSQQIDAFRKRGLHQLDYALATTKTISLKQVKVPPKKVKLPQEVRNIRFSLDWDYDTLLEKFAKGTIQPDDIIGSVEKLVIKDQEVVLNEFNDVDEEMEIETPHQKVEQVKEKNYEEDERILANLPVQRFGRTI